MKSRSWRSWISGNMKSRSWQTWTFGSLALLFLLTCVGLLIWAIHQFGWDWTGFNAYSSPTPQYQRSKTLWDWLQLLIVPAILAAGAGFFTWWNVRTEQQIAQQRYDQDRKIAEQRYQQDQELALDKQREDLLQSYLDRMTELLLNKKLRKSRPNAEVRKVALTRTVSTLIQLDSKRARTILVFLDEARLREEPDPIISFKDADLSNVKWSKGNLREVNLHEANLREANLREADLFGADLHGTYLREADLFGADLHGAILRKADLRGAILRKADLRFANLSRVDLRFANLSGVNLSEANLSGADLGSVQHLEEANLEKTILRGVTGLTPEQFAYCKASGAVVDEAATPSTSSLQNGTSQETTLQAPPSSDHAILPTHAQEAMSEALSSQKHTAVEKEATASTPYSQDHVTPLSSSQQGNSPVPPIQDNTTLPSISQNTAP